MAIDLDRAVRIDADRNGMIAGRAAHAPRARRTIGLQCV
jgi:hypothetical protein